MDKEDTIARLLTLAEKIQNEEAMDWQDRAMLAELLHIGHLQLAEYVHRKKSQSSRKLSKAEQRIAEKRDWLASLDPPF